MEGRYGLSAAALKYLAALFMLVDHMGVVFPTMLSDMGLPTWADLLPRLIGRLAFPIFAYFVAEGCRRTRFFSRYLIRLGLFAFLSQVPFTLATGTLGGSVILTFFLAAGSVWGFERAIQAGRGPAAASLPLLVACVLALVSNCDYGFPAVLLIFALYLQGEDRKRLLICLGIGIALIYLVYQPFVGLLTLIPYMKVIALFPTILLTLLKSADTGESFWLLLFYLFLVFALVQMIEDMLLVPRIMGRITGLNPAIILLSLSVWGTLLGITGMVIALPVTSLMLAYYRRYRLYRDGQDEAGELSSLSSLFPFSGPSQAAPQPTDEPPAPAEKADGGEGQ